MGHLTRQDPQAPQAGPDAQCSQSAKEEASTGVRRSVDLAHFDSLSICR
jgi:hypothetical protein